MRRARGLRPAGVRLGLALTAALLPPLVLERLTRPFVERLTTLFERDAELGWRNRPLAEDTYWGVPARIDALGMRGAGHARAKPPGTRRVLVLGDSVVFGLSLADEAETLPSRLERELAQLFGTPFECLNAGVAGWSTWQERRYLEREGEGLDPDLVVLVFVLNDVTQPQNLARSGGEGFQLAYARPPGLPGWLAGCGLYLAARELALRRALAGDTPAAREHAARLTPYHLMLEPGSARAEAAWQAGLAELAGLLEWCRARGRPLFLAVSPYALQLERPELDAPQRVLARFAGERGLPFADLLPVLAAAARTRGLAKEALFLDGLHPTALGHELAAHHIALELRAQRVLR